MESIRATLRTEARELWRDGRGKILLAIAVPWALLVGYRMALPLLLPQIQSEFGLTLSVVGLLVTILWLGGAVGQLPGGILADHYGESTLMSISLGLVAVAFVFVALAPNAIALFLAVAVWGLGHSLFPIARITKLAEIFPDRLGSALGLTMATGDVGQTVLPPIVSGVALVLVWQAGFVIAIPLFLLTGLIIWTTVPEMPESNTSVGMWSTENAREILDIVKHPVTIFMIFILFLYIFLWQAFTAFFPTYLISEKDLSPFVASILFGVFFGAGAVIKPISGMAFDRIGLRHSLILIFVCPVLGLLFLPGIDSLVLLLLVTLLVSTMLGTGAITQSFLAVQFPTDIQGSGLGVVRAITAVLGSSGPAVFGFIAERGFFDEAYIALAVILVIVMLLTYSMPQSDIR